MTGIVGAAGGLGGFVPPLLMGATYNATDNNYTIGLGLLSLTCLVALAYTGFRMPGRARSDRSPPLTSVPPREAHLEARIRY